MSGRIALVGEAWGKDEEEAGRSFAGSSGRLLNALLAQVGINRDECLVTSVFNLRPQPRVDVANLCGPKVDGIKGMPYLVKGKYVNAKYAPELERLEKEIEDFDPSVIVAMGAAAAWAFLHTSGIRQIRGAPALGVNGRKILPTYNPAAVQRDFKIRPIMLADLFKAKRESEYPEVRRPSRQIWLDPTLADIEEFYEKFITPAPYLSIDIETKGETITCVGFAPTIDRALVIPFYNPMKPDGNYWPNLQSELRAWDWVRKLCLLDKKIVFQNGLYDMSFLWRTMGITCPGAADDTMLLHHALQPEMEKGLGFMATVYTDEASWKFMRKGSATIKKED